MTERPFGNAPDHWEVTTLGRLGGFLKGFGGSKEDEVGAGVPCVRYGDLYAFHGFITETRSFVDPAKAEGYAPVRAGDVLFAASGETLEEIGKSAVNLLAEEAVVGGDVIVLRPTRPVNHRFLGYACQSEPLALQKTRAGKGVTVMHIYPAGLRNVRIAIPPLGEQDAIVRYLDHVDSRIQRLIAAKERLIELLEEEKQALIHRAVTRGLDPGVPLKPSGVDWLMKVPAHWNVTRLKALTQHLTSGSRGWSDYGSDHGPRFVRIANLTRGTLDLDWRDTVRLDLPPEVRDGEGARSAIQPQDLLLSITAHIGSVAVAPESIGEAYVSQHVALCRIPDDRAKARWLGYVLLSEVGQTYGRLTMYGGTKQGLSLDDVGGHVVPMPPVEEQAKLVRFLDESVAERSAAASMARRQIQLLREYRTRVTSDVVTGKLDVREAAALPGDPDADDPRVDEQLEETMAG